MLMIAKPNITDLDQLSKAIQIKLLQELPRPKDNKETLTETDAKKRLLINCFFVTIDLFIDMEKK
jgi:hypothetical protein